MLNIKETADTLKTKAAKVNQDILKASDTVVDETLAAGEEWNKVLGKALKTGTHLFGQQQELALDALEGLKKQYNSGNKRLRKLLGFRTAQKAVANAVETVGEVIVTAEKKAKKVLATTVTRAEEEVQTTAAKTKKVLASTKPAPTKKVLSSTKKAAPAKKVLSSTKKAVAVKTKTPNDLKVINGIGPKTEKVLNAAGVMTYADLAAFKAEGLKNVLSAESLRYSADEPQAWIDEAKKFLK